MKYSIVMVILVLFLTSCYRDVIEKVEIDSSEELLVLNLELHAKMAVEEIYITDKEGHICSAAFFTSKKSNRRDHFIIDIEKDRIIDNEIYLLSIRKFNHAYYEWELSFDYDTDISEYNAHLEFLK